MSQVWVHITQTSKKSARFVYSIILYCTSSQNGETLAVIAMVRSVVRYADQ